MWLWLISLLLAKASHHLRLLRQTTNRKFCIEEEIDFDAEGQSQGVRIRLQAAGFRAATPETVIRGSRPQGIEGSGMSGLSDTLGSLWPPLAIRPWIEGQKYLYFFVYLNIFSSFPANFPPRLRSNLISFTTQFIAEIES
jgi:hypothetical protein